MLQPTAYMQNILSAWDGIVRAGVFKFPYPAQTRLSLVDLDDVGEAAAIVLTQGGHGGATYELAATPALSQIEVASLLSRALGRDVRGEEEPLAAWQARAGAAGMGEYEQATLAAMCSMAWSAMPIHCARCSAARRLASRAFLSASV